MKGEENSLPSASKYLQWWRYPISLVRYEFQFSQIALFPIPSIDILKSRDKMVLSFKKRRAIPIILKTFQCEGAFLPGNMMGKASTGYGLEFRWKNLFLLFIFYSMTDIKNIATGRANKKPFCNITFLFKHRVKTIFIPTRRTDFKFIFHCYISNFVFHGIPLLKILMLCN